MQFASTCDVLGPGCSFVAPDTLVTDKQTEKRMFYSNILYSAKVKFIMKIITMHDAYFHEIDINKCICVCVKLQSGMPLWISICLLCRNSNWTCLVIKIQLRNSTSAVWRKVNDSTAAADEQKNSFSVTMVWYVPVDPLRHWHTRGIVCHLCYSIESWSPAKR